MAKAKVRGRRANEVKSLINDSVAVQIELLSAAVKVWSTMFDSLAAFAKTASGEALSVSARGDANQALDNVIRAARAKLKDLTALPNEIGRDFESRVRVRARAKR